MASNMGGDEGGGVDGNDVIPIDGSLLEGGGQVLRTALSLSTIQGKPVKIFNIRAGRNPAGLRAQHLTGVNLIGEICRGVLHGAKPGSMEVTLHPGTITGGKYNAETGTAGSVGLLLQVALPPLIYVKPAGLKSRLFLCGGTNADFAPQVDYTDKVFSRIASKFGVKMKLEIHRRGYFPKGGGEIMVDIESVNKLKAADLMDMGQIVNVKGLAFVAGALPAKMSTELAEHAQKLLRRHLPPEVKIDIHAYKEAYGFAIGSACGITLFAETSTGMILGGSSLGRRGRSTKDVGEEAAEEIVSCVKANVCVDKWAQDQVILFMALAEGKSRMKTLKLTLHTLTAISVAEQITGVKFKIEEEDDVAVVECEGIGFSMNDM